MQHAASELAILPLTCLVMLSVSLEGSVGQGGWMLCAGKDSSPPPIRLWTELYFGELPRPHGLIIHRTIFSFVNLAGLTGADAAANLHVDRHDVDLVDPSARKQASGPRLPAVPIEKRRLEDHPFEVTDPSLSFASFSPCSSRV